MVQISDHIGVLPLTVRFLSNQTACNHTSCRVENIQSWLIPKYLMDDSPVCNPSKHYYLSHQPFITIYNPSKNPLSPIKYFLNLFFFFLRINPLHSIFPLCLGSKSWWTFHYSVIFYVNFSRFLFYFILFFLGSIILRVNLFIFLYSLFVMFNSKFLLLR